jgi:hypothetical protein
MFRYFLPSLVLVFGLTLLSCGQQRFFRPLQNARTHTVCVDGTCYQQSSAVVVNRPIVSRSTVTTAYPRFEPLPAPTAAEVAISETSGDSFRQSLLSAAIQAANKNEIKRVDVLRLRVALMSPAFRKHAEDLAVTQMYFHAGELAIGSDGTIDRVSVDWSRTIEFLAKLIPLILELLKVIG